MTTKVKPVPEGFHSITPVLTLKDSRKAIEFYKKAFGARVLELMPSPDGKGTMHAAIKIGDSVLMMGDERPGQRCKSAETLGGSPVNLYIYVPNVDTAFKQAIATGATQTGRLPRITAT
jgi:PhnB protein